MMEYIMILRMKYKNKINKNKMNKIKNLLSKNNK